MEETIDERDLEQASLERLAESAKRLSSHRESSRELRSQLSIGLAGSRHVSMRRA